MAPYNRAHNCIRPKCDGSCRHSHSDTPPYTWHRNDLADMCRHTSHPDILWRTHIRRWPGRRWHYSSSRTACCNHVPSNPLDNLYWNYRSIIYVHKEKDFAILLSLLLAFNIVRSVVQLQRDRPTDILVLVLPHSWIFRFTRAFAWTLVGKNYD